MVGVLVGLWFMAMGAWGATHATHDPETPAAHWLSFPAGRRIGGILTVGVGLTMAAACLLWL